MLLYSTGYLKGEFHVPFWVVLLCHVAIAPGTLAGGWRVIETLGMRMTKLIEGIVAGGVHFETLQDVLLKQKLILLSSG